MEIQKMALSWRLMKATEQACYSVCCAEEAAVHYGDTLSKLDCLSAWFRGFFESWNKDHLCEINSLKAASLPDDVTDWKVKKVVDADGHLTLFVAHTDGSPIIEVDEDLGSDVEFFKRLTTRDIESKYRNNHHPDNVYYFINSNGFYFILSNIPTIVLDERFSSRVIFDEGVFIALISDRDEIDTDQVLPSCYTIFIKDGLFCIFDQRGFASEIELAAGAAAGVTDLFIWLEAFEV